jgi:hypothetical protein
MNVLISVTEDQVQQAFSELVPKMDEETFNRFATILFRRDDRRNFDITRPLNNVCKLVMLQHALTFSQLGLSKK